MSKFKKIIIAKSNEVSLCSKYNSGANKQTQFELIKNKENSQPVDIKPILKQLIAHCDLVKKEVDVVKDFQDYLNYWLEHDVNRTLYSLLSQDLQNRLETLSDDLGLTKEEKEQEFIKLFNEFLVQFRNLPITKTADNKYEVSLVSQSRIQEQDTNPQNETTDITKEKTSEMENEEQKTVIQKAIELLTSAFSLKKTETPADETPEEVKPEGENQEAEKPAETEEIKPEAEPVGEEAPVIEKAEETVESEAETEIVEKVGEPAEPEAKTEEAEQPTEEVQEEPAAEEATEPEVVEKSSEPSELETVLKQKLDLEKELVEMKKAQAEKEEAITKMSYIQKAKDEYSMLVGTPEEIGAKLYDISKSNLTEDSKSFILDQLKKVAQENQELTEEVGSMTKNSELTPEEEIYAKAEEIAKSKGISINKALREVK